MAQSVRVEFIRLGDGSSPLNIIRGTEGAAINALAVSNTATATESRPVAPSGGNDKYGICARLIAKDNPVYTAFGADPTATLTNSVKLMPDIPEIIYLQDGHKLSFIAESA